jgi:diketogulonate reductase-like aldo/keto reductase
VDSLVLHSPVAPHALLMRVWAAMEAIHKAGGARQLGISNCYDARVMRQLYDDADVKPAVVQNRFYRATGYDTELRHLCGDLGVRYQSFWTLTANPHILASEALHTLAQEHDKTEVQIFFRFLKQSGIVPLTGTCSEEHMREDLSILDFELSSHQMAEVTRLLRQA